MEGPEPVALTRTIVEVLQSEQIREHGGRQGLRDAGLLESAVARARHVWSQSEDADLAALAAACGYGLARSHPFLDGNERIAFVAMNVFLILNGYEIDVAEPALVDTMLRVAAGDMNAAELGEWIRSTLTPLSS